MIEGKWRHKDQDDDYCSDCRERRQSDDGVCVEVPRNDQLNHTESSGWEIGFARNFFDNGIKVPNRVLGWVCIRPDEAANGDSVDGNDDVDEYCPECRRRSRRSQLSLLNDDTLEFGSTTVELRISAPDS